MKLKCNNPSGLSIDLYRIQGLMSYRLDDPGTAPGSLAERRNSAQARGLRAMRSYMVSAKLIQLIAFDFVAGEVAERFKAHAWKACVG